MTNALTAAAQSSTPSWLPAVSAILGALVGGFASYFSNRAFDRSRRRAEDARWRKENVYLPIRDELLALLEPPQGRAAYLDAVDQSATRFNEEREKNLPTLQTRRARSGR